MHKPQATLPPLRRLPVITYRVTLDVPLQLVIKVSNLLRKRRKELGTRNGTRARRPACRDRVGAARLVRFSPSPWPFRFHGPAYRQAGSARARTAAQVLRGYLPLTSQGPGRETAAQRRI
jgi:hypothetical protein